MKYPNPLCKGDTIGVCAPSSGIIEKLHPQLDKAIANVKALGYKVVETESIRCKNKCVSADSKTRTKEFMNLYENQDVKAIIPPWGGEFLMDMLPYLDFERLCNMSPKWVCGYSDITTLTFPLTIHCDMATIHGSNFMNMGYVNIHDSDMQLFDVMSKDKRTQSNSEYWGSFTGCLTKEAYNLNNKTVIQSLRREPYNKFEGRMIGGCMDVLCKLIGTRLASILPFLEKYKNDGWIWTLESCEMSAADIYRTLWQMRECGWFEYCNGVMIGRPDGYSDTQDFTFHDALEQGLGELDVPVIYGADIGHVPPQMQIINGAYGMIEYKDGNITMKQEWKS